MSQQWHAVMTLWIWWHCSCSHVAHTSLQPPERWFLFRLLPPSSSPLISAQPLPFSVLFNLILIWFNCLYSSLLTYGSSCPMIWSFHINFSPMYLLFRAERNIMCGPANGRASAQCSELHVIWASEHFSGHCQHKLTCLSKTDMEDEESNDVGKGLCGDKNVMCCCCQFNIIKLVVSSKISCFDISFLVACSFCWNRLWWFYDSCQTLEHTAHSLHFSVFYAKAVGEN